MGRGLSELQQTILRLKEPKRLTRPGKLILELPGAGAIHVLGPDRVLDNGTLAPPPRAPTPAEQQRNDTFLDAAREALGGSQGTE